MAALILNKLKLHIIHQVIVKSLEELINPTEENQAPTEDSFPGGDQIHCEPSRAPFKCGNDFFTFYRDESTTYELRVFFHPAK